MVTCDKILQSYLGIINDVPGAVGFVTQYLYLTSAGGCVNADDLLVTAQFAHRTLPIIWKLRENPMFVARWTPACSAAVALFGSFWFVERVYTN